MVEARSLRKAVVPSTLIQNPSPGNIQSTRLALHVSKDGSSCWAYIASGSHIYKLQISLEDSLVNKGKESLLIPGQAQVMDSFLVNRCPHRSEIQSIVLTETESTDYLMLGSVDSYGHLIVSKLDTTGKDANRLTYSVLPQDGGVGEGSWAGLCFSPSQLSMAAVARSFCKTIDVYDQDIHVRTLHTLWYPSSLNFIKNLFHGNESSILAITEGCQLTIWDIRMKENGGCLHRICGSPGDVFYAVCGSSTGNVAVGGADRTVTIFDPRRWSALSRWVHCSKYESAEVIPTVEGFVAVGTESIPPSSVIKQLAVAVEAGKKLKSLKDCLASSASSSPVRERAGLSLSAVKSLVLREKEEKLTFDYGDNEKVLSLINSLFDAEGNFLRRKISYDSEATTVTSLPRIFMVLLLKALLLS
ncbi:hypothetical protein CMV_000682 [Castanea mollissima]|uniref:Uncharacterized protein n=1 Tax=Castanea mollissima TaxID=60419 RepID=A0A8J4S0W7_9ROSI|nr:hypothetical protein CMV_000682 [Castanea mollissima]